MNNGCTEHPMPWWKDLRRIWNWRRPAVASPLSGDHDPITGEPYYRMLPTDDGGESYEMECLLLQSAGQHPGKQVCARRQVSSEAGIRIISGCVATKIRVAPRQSAAKNSF